MKIDYNDNEKGVLPNEAKQHETMHYQQDT